MSWREGTETSRGFYGNRSGGKSPPVAVEPRSGSKGASWFRRRYPFRLGQNRGQPTPSGCTEFWPIAIQWEELKIIIYVYLSICFLCY